MPSYAELISQVDENIRKGLNVSIFVKPAEDGDDEIEALLDATGLLALPTGYTDVGRLTKDQGASWTREVEVSDVTSVGAAQPTRRDVTSDVSGLQFTMQESKRAAFELYEGQDLSAVTADANGNIVWDKPDRPARRVYRVLALGKDGDGTDAFYFAKWLPRAEVTDRAEQGWNEENEIQYGVTLTAFVDQAVGTSIRTLWGVPASRVAQMGFTTAP